MTKKASIHNGEKTISLINDVWKTGQMPMQKDETELLFYAIYKNKQNGLKA